MKAVIFISFRHDTYAGAAADGIKKIFCIVGRYSTVESYLKFRHPPATFLATSTLAANITGEECLTKYQQEQDNLKIVLAFYDEAFGQHNITAVDKYISPDYIQHNPKVGDGQQPLVDFLVPFNAIKVKGPVDIRHIAVNGDLVWLHLKTTGFSGEPLAIIDVFRVEDGKIIEHWDVIQEIPSIKDSKNSHPMF